MTSPTWFRSALASTVLLVLTLYPTLAIQIYVPAWYELGCEWHSRCDRLKKMDSSEAIRQLAAYWRHQGELKDPWSEKERQHLAEVRPLYDGIAVLFLVALMAAPWVLRGASLTRAARNNALLILLLLPGLLAFRSFWMEVFHPLLFDNQLWKNTRADLSWYFMPPTFFQYSAGMLLGVALTANLFVWVAARQRSKSLD